MRMKKDIMFPDCWEEIQPDEWIHLLKLRGLLAMRCGVSLADVKRAWCAFVLRHRGLTLHDGRREDMLLVDRLAATTGWMWQVDRDTPAVSLDFSTTANLLPVWKGLAGPASHGADLTFGEFHAATVAMNLYTSAHAEQDLLAMVSVLYRRPDPQTGRRVPFVPDDLPGYMRDASRMPGWLRWGVYAWFAYFCRFLQEETFIIDGSEICFAPIFERSPAGRDGGRMQDLGLNSILYTVAESQVFGTAPETARTPLLRVLLKLLDDKQRTDDLLKRAKKR